MRVLQINSVCGIGSTGRIATDIHKLLIEKGHESYIAYGRGMAENCDSTIKIGSIIDNYAHVAKTRILDRHGFGSKKATHEFINKVKELNPDVIHLHNIHGYYINIEILFEYLKMANKPVVWTLHDCWAFTGHCAYFDYVGCNKWTTGCYACPEKNSYPASIIVDGSEKNYFKKKDIFTGVANLTIVTPSKWLAGLVERSFLGEYPITVINNGIDLEIFKPTYSILKEKYNIEDKFIILGVASVWDRRKGLDYFIELSSQLNQDELIILVGVSEKQKENLPRNILGISRTNRIEELVELYSLADIFVNPTMEEVMGMTNVESLACGTPVITFDTGGSVECVDKNTGTIVEKGNVNQLRDEIYNFRRGMKSFNPEKCIERAHLLYNKNNRFMEYLDIYSEKI